MLKVYLFGRQEADKYTQQNAKPRMGQETFVLVQGMSVYIHKYMNKYIYIYSRNAQLFLNKYLYIYIYYIIYRYKVSVYNPNKSSEKWSRVDLDLNLNFKNILCWQPTGWQIGEKEN